MRGRLVHRVNHNDQSDDHYMYQWILPCFVFGFIAGGVSSTAVVIYELLKKSDEMTSTELYSSGLSIDEHKASDTVVDVYGDDLIIVLPFCDILGPTTLDLVLISTCIDHERYELNPYTKDVYSEFLCTARDMVVSGHRVKMDTHPI